MFEDQLELGDELGTPGKFSSVDDPFFACARVVWRKGKDGEFRAIGTIFTVESSSGVVLAADNLIAAIASAEELCISESGSAETVVEALELSPVDPETNCQVVTKIQQAIGFDSLIDPDAPKHRNASGPKFPPGDVGPIPPPPPPVVVRRPRRRP